jgi:ribosome-binding factor A
VGYPVFHPNITFMQETRQNRIARLLQKELSLIFQSQTRLMHGVMISVTRVRVSPDLSICTAYLSVFPSERSTEFLNNIESNLKTIRYELGTRIHNQLRIIPELRFFIDDSLDYIDRIDELLKK